MALSGEGALICLPRIISFLCSNCPVSLQLKRKASFYKGLQGPGWSSHTHPATPTTSNHYQRPTYHEAKKLKLQVTSPALSIPGPGCGTKTGLAPRNPITCDTMNGTWRHFAKWNKSKTNTVSSQLHLNPKIKLFFIEKRDQTCGYQRQGEGRGELEECGQRYKFAVTR